jgi:hypothetical protein
MAFSDDVLAFVGATSVAMLLLLEAPGKSIAAEAAPTGI